MSEAAKLLREKNNRKCGALLYTIQTVNNWLYTIKRYFRIPQKQNIWKSYITHHAISFSTTYLYTYIGFHSFFSLNICFYAITYLHPGSWLRKWNIFIPSLNIIYQKILWIISTCLKLLKYLLDFHVDNYFMTFFGSSQKQLFQLWTLQLSSKSIPSYLLHMSKMPTAATFLP